MHPHLSGTVGEDLVPVLKLNAEHRVGQRLYNRSFENNGIFLWLGQVSLLEIVLSLHTPRWAHGSTPNHAVGGISLTAPPEGARDGLSSYSLRRLAPTRSHKGRKTAETGRLAEGGPLFHRYGRVKISGPCSVTAIVCSK